MLELSTFGSVGGAAGNCRLYPAKAARGIDGRIYPWGNDPPTPELCTFDMSQVYCPLPVGSHSPQGDSPYGCADMAGNLYQWTSSNSARYPYVADGSREVYHSRAFVVTTGYRGGYYCSNAADMRSARRHHTGGGIDQRDRDGHVMRFPTIGFRIVVAKSRYVK